MWVWVAIAGLAAVVVVTVAVAVIGTSGHALLGDTDPGPFVRFGAGLVRVLADASGAVCTGALVFAALLVPSRRDGILRVGGYAAVRTAGWSAVLWLVTSAAMIVLDTADASGKPLSEMDASGVAGQFEALETPKAWAVTAVLALVVVIGCRVALSWRSVVGLAVVAAVGLLPPVVAGHVSVGNGHDLATNAAIGHVVAAAVWSGTLVVLVAHVRRGTEYAELACRRYRTVALVCWVVLAFTGVVQGLVLVPLSDVLSTRYGLMSLGKVVLLGLLGVVGVWARRRAVMSKPSPWRLAGVDILLLGVTFGVSVAMVRQPPPAFVSTEQSALDALIGYDILTPPGFWQLLTAWRFDLVLGTAAIVLAVGYLAGIRALRRRGDAWPRGRTVSWLLGCLVLLLTTSSGVGRYAPGAFSIHMVTHMLLNMLIPALLVLGAPATLALRVLPPGPREWLMSLLHSRVAREVTHPLVACVLLVGSYYALYMTDLFASALRYHWAHVLMNIHFLGTGYVFYWVVIGIDPGPRRLPHLGRLGTLFAVMPFHAFFGVILMSSQNVIAENFYRSLSLPWSGDLLADQRLGGGIAWASGELPVLVVVIALLVQWSRADERAARRHDRSPGSDDELAAYNAMLAKLAESRRQ
ncbi:putative copper resistance protein D [Actinocrispum wychmicini]|uniref:Putative copper resistance protein D n=1 Tax=Actinocrispum wychmicini TaxID=1213861 RepID=A0A4R2IQD4_9PSEU|nr:putative copper resistance protein D [Actinocrispum wychmicini]